MKITIKQFLLPFLLAVGLLSTSRASAMETIVEDMLAVLRSVELSPAPDYSDCVNLYERNTAKDMPHIAHAIKRSDGYVLHAREFAREKAQDNSKPTLILMHGFPDSLHAYDLVIPNLMKSHHVISFDFLGWGNSEKPEHHVYDAASMLSDLNTVIEYFKPSKVTLVIHDLSGFPGIDWALQNPERIHNLILLNTFYMPSKSLVSPDYIKRFATPGVQRDISVAVARHNKDYWYDVYSHQLNQFFSDEKIKEIYLKIFSKQSFNSRNAFFSAASTLRSEVAARAKKIDQMRHFPARVKIIFGEDDKALNVGMAEEFQQIFPDSELYVIKNANHFVHLDQPRRVAEIIATE